MFRFQWELGDFRQHKVEKSLIDENAERVFKVATNSRQRSLGEPSLVSYCSRMSVGKMKLVFAVSNFITLLGRRMYPRKQVAICTLDSSTWLQW